MCLPASRTVFEQLLLFLPIINKILCQKLAKKKKHLIYKY